MGTTGNGGEKRSQRKGGQSGSYSGQEEGSDADRSNRGRMGLRGMALVLEERR